MRLRVPKAPEKHPFEMHHPRFKKVFIADCNAVDAFISMALIENLRIATDTELYSDGNLLMNWLETQDKLSEIPELIFIDPEMPGFGLSSFLQAFSGLSDFVKNKCKIVIISSKLNESARTEALSNPCVVRYFYKPLDAFQLRELNPNSNV